MTANPENGMGMEAATRPRPATKGTQGREGGHLVGRMIIVRGARKQGMSAQGSGAGMAWGGKVKIKALGSWAGVGCSHWCLRERCPAGLPRQPCFNKSTRSTGTSWA